MKSDKNKIRARKATLFATSTAAGIGLFSMFNNNAVADVSPALPVDAPNIGDLTVTAKSSITVYARNAQLKLTASSDKNIVVPGSTVTYTYKVANTGDLDFKNVVVEDDKCSPVTYVSGNNSDPFLNVGETWTYTCSTKVLKDQTDNAQVTANPVLPTSTPSPTPSSTGTPTPSPSSTTGGVKDGTYLGSVATVNVANQGLTYPIQVQAVVSGGKITSITVPVFGATDATSKNIGRFSVATTSNLNNDPANPTMIYEAISGQTANIATISGATYTTAGFKTSLAAALAQAGL